MVHVSDMFGCGVILFRNVPQGILRLYHIADDPRAFLQFFQIQLFLFDIQNTVLVHDPNSK